MDRVLSASVNQNLEILWKGFFPNARRPLGTKIQRCVFIGYAISYNYGPSPFRHSCTRSGGHGRSWQSGRNDTQNGSSWARNR
jgi:hypothetical protein